MIESILTSSITVWFGNTTDLEKKALNKVVRRASRTVGTDLPALEGIYQARLLSRANNIARDPYHPAAHLFVPLRSGRRYRSLPTSVDRFTNSFFPSAVRLLNDRSEGKLQL